MATILLFMHWSGALATYVFLLLTGVFLRVPRADRHLVPLATLCLVVGSWGSFVWLVRDRLKSIG